MVDKLFKPNVRLPDEMIAAQPPRPLTTSPPPLPPEVLDELKRTTVPVDPFRRQLIEKAIRDRQFASQYEVRPPKPPPFTGPYLKIAALCPTYRRTTLVQNTLWQWLQQDYPIEHRKLIILDDGQTFDTQEGEGWMVYSEPERLPHMPAKYKRMRELAPDFDAYLVWDDDDLFFPGYVTAHARCLLNADVSMPECVLSYYGSTLTDYWHDGTLHGTAGFRREAGDAAGWWPEEFPLRMSYDREMVNALRRVAKNRQSPWSTYSESEWAFGYSGSPSPHSSSFNYLGDEWYRIYGERTHARQYIGTLTPLKCWRWEVVMKERERRGWL